MTIPRQHGSVNLETKPTKRRSEDVDYSPITNRIIKVQKKEYLIKNACYSPAKYYLCKQNNKRSLLGRKQRSQVVRSFLNRYQFSFINKVTSLFSIRYTLINILRRKTIYFTNSFLFYRFLFLYFTLFSCVKFIAPFTGFQNNKYELSKMQTLRF